MPSRTCRSDLSPIPVAVAWGVLRWRGFGYQPLFYVLLPSQSFEASGQVNRLRLVSSMGGESHNTAFLSCLFTGAPFPIVPLGRKASTLAEFTVRNSRLQLQRWLFDYILSLLTGYILCKRLLAVCSEQDRLQNTDVVAK